MKRWERNLEFLTMSGQAAIPAFVLYALPGIPGTSMSWLYGIAFAALELIIAWRVYGLKD